jgi:hypothetical protein
LTKRISPGVDSRLLPTANIDEIFRLWGLELTDRQIAAQIGINHATVASYRRKRGVGPNGWARRFLDLVDEGHARCSRCKEVKSLKGWPRQSRKNGESYRYSYCPACNTKRHNKSANRNADTNLRVRWTRLRTRSAKLGIICTISFDDFVAQWISQDERCFYTDRLMLLDYGNGFSPDSCSVDKVDPERGYVLGNVVFATRRANTVKHDLTLDEMRQWMPGWAGRIEAWQKSCISTAILEKP